MKLLRTLKLDRSDTFVFERAAASGEWAVPGGFMFWDLSEDEAGQLTGKARAAFRSGFLGVASQGWSTLAEVAEANGAAVEAATAALARFILTSLGAPDFAAARAAAVEEIAFSASLCDHSAGTVVALQRSFDDTGAVRERFRTLKPTLAPAENSFAQGCVLPIGVARGEDEDGPDGNMDGIEEVDFVGMMGARSDIDGNKERS